MANPALTLLAWNSLKWTTEQLVSSKLQSYFDDGIAQMSGGTDTEQILYKLDGVLKDVQDTKDIASRMSQKLDEGILNLRKDMLRSHFETIESIFEKIQNCIVQAMENTQKIKNPAELKKSLADLQKEQEDELRDAVYMVPEQLNHINGFLTNTDFIRTAAEVALQDSKDFLSYYKKMETLFTAYWGRVVQGIVLLNMAHFSPNVRFREATHTIDTHGEKLHKQVNIFYDVLGHDLCLMAQSLLATASNPNVRVPVYFSSGWGKGIKVQKRWRPVMEERSFLSNLIAGPKMWQYTEGPQVPGTWGYQGLKVVNSDERYKYHLEPATNVSSGKEFDLTKSYPMRLWGSNIEVKDCLNRFEGVGDLGGPYAISMDTDSDYDWRQESTKWHIRPVSVGSNNFYFEGVGDSLDGAVLVTRIRDNELEWRENLDLRRGFDDCVDRAYFQLRPVS